MRARIRKDNHKESALQLNVAGGSGAPPPLLDSKWPASQPRNNKKCTSSARGATKTGAPPCGKFEQNDSQNGTRHTGIPTSGKSSYTNGNNGTEAVGTNQELNPAGLSRQRQNLYVLRTCL